ncbi:MAG TPA: hypothetical protein PK847_13485 [Candidatus Sumerlaeota bacterium]|nr:hypothetical protein [Candidatus Sumerlaeota bacterium]HOR29161.1 hypothetical protein [Candidatus Sumerlaeota bacterium]
MTHQELQEYLQAQVSEIRKHQWIESERQQREVKFDQAAMDWISRYGAEFHNFWFSRRRERELAVR